MQTFNGLVRLITLIDFHARKLICQVIFYQFWSAYVQNYSDHEI